jgi:hypothetical protein
MTDEGATDWRADGHATVPDIGLDRADNFVLGNLAAVAVPHADAAADPSRTVSGRRDDARRRSLRLENRDSPLELCLLLKQGEEGRIVRVAVFANLTELLGHLLAAERPQRLELRTQLAMTVSGNEHVVDDRGGECAHRTPLSVGECLCQVRLGEPALEIAIWPWGESPISLQHLLGSRAQMRLWPDGGPPPMARWLPRARGGECAEHWSARSMTTSQGRAALEMGVELSDRFGLRLVLAYASDGPAAGNGADEVAAPVSMNAARKGVARLLAQLAAEHGVADRAERRFGTGDAAAVIAQIAAEEQPT